MCRATFFVISAYLLHCQRRDLGRLSLAWLTLADHAEFGPAHPTTIALQEAACIQLDSFKTGKQASKKELYSASLLPKPMYLHDSIKNQEQELTAAWIQSTEDRLQNDFLTTSGTASHRSRILQSLFDIASGAIQFIKSTHDVQKAQVSVGGSCGLELDPHLQFHERNAMERRYFDGKFARWSDLFKQYCRRMAEALKQSPERGAYSSVSLMDALKSEYQATFDCDAEEMYTSTYSSMFGALGSIEQRSGYTSGLSLQRHMLEYCREVLALAVYAGVYRSASVSKYTGEYPLSFCWDVCGTELHDIKRRRMNQDQGLHPQYFKDIDCM